MFASCPTACPCATWNHLMLRSFCSSLCSFLVWLRLCIHNRTRENCPVQLRKELYTKLYRCKPFVLGRLSYALILNNLNDLEMCGRLHCPLFQAFPQTSDLFIWSIPTEVVPLREFLVYHTKGAGFQLLHLTVHHLTISLAIAHRQFSKKGQTIDRCRHTLVTVSMGDRIQFERITKYVQN